MYNIRCYFNTGFDEINIPSSRAVLETATYKDFQAVDLLQDRDLSEIYIQANWDDVKNVDYCLVGETYYIVTGVAMANLTTSVLGLICDYWTTLGGVTGIEVEGGWLSRAHVSDDALFKYVLPEPFTPNAPLELKGGIELLELSKKNFTLIQSTVNIPGVQTVNIDAIKFGVGEESGVCPKLPPVLTESVVSMKKYNNQGVLESISTRLPNSGLYNSGDDSLETQEKFDNIRQGLGNGRSIGVESAITAQYNIPIELINLNESVIAETNQVANLVAYEIEASFNSNKALNFIYNDSIKNLKAFSGAINRYILVSNCSGNKVEMLPENCYYSGLASPIIYISSDLRSTGQPYAVFKYYHNKINKDFILAVKGLNWQNEPLVYTDKSGSSIDTYNFFSQQYQAAQNYYSGQMTSAVRGILNTASSVYGSSNVTSDVYNKQGQLIKNNTSTRQRETVGGALGSGMAAFDATTSILQNAANYNVNRERNIFNFTAGQNLIVPDVQFARDEGVRDFIGNNFIIYRYSLSEADLQRYDKFLTMYGYTVSTDFSSDYLTNRKYFNFILADSVHINSPIAPIRFREGAEEQLRSGVRLWHVLPDDKYYTDNPIS